MKEVKVFLIPVCVLTLFVMTPQVSTAEWFGDIYLGATTTNDTNIDIESSSSSFLGFTSQSKTQRVDFDNSFTVGVRGGYYSETLPWLGLAMDLSYFKADGQNAKIDVFPVSLLLMLRYPLFKSENFPRGRLQPYAGIGPALFFSNSKLEFQPPVSESASGFSIDSGIDIRFGLAWQFHKRLALFGEYRYTNFRIDSKQTDLLYGFAGTEDRMTTRLTTDHFLMGISYRF
jgi:opacity protein-like surface antigen